MKLRDPKRGCLELHQHSSEVRALHYQFVTLAESPKASVPGISPATNVTIITVPLGNPLSGMNSLSFYQSSANPFRQTYFPVPAYAHAPG